MKDRLGMIRNVQTNHQVTESKHFVVSGKKRKQKKRGSGQCPRGICHSKWNAMGHFLGCLEQPRAKELVVNKQEKEKT